MNKRILILVNAYSALEANLNQSKRLQEEFLKLGIRSDILKNNYFPMTISQNTICGSVSQYDFCVYLDKDKYVSEMLETAGLKLFNSHTAIQVCDDKLSTYLRLAGSGLNLAKTLPGLLCYDDESPIPTNTVERIEQELLYPIVVKECYGSLGKSVYKADNRTELLKIMQKVKYRPHLFQQFIQSSFGKDMRIIVIGGKLCAAMLRRSKKDFRSNIDLGGEGIRITPDPQFVAAAIKASNLLNLDYSGVDLLFGEDGEPVVCEVNSNAFFTAMERVSGVNVAKCYAEHMFCKVYGKLPN